MSLTATRTILQYLCVLSLFSFSATLQGEEMGGNPYHCPEEHVYVYCGELHSNYDYYGYPKATYGYGSEITIQGPWTEEYLDKCGKGKIIRKWKIKYHYETYWCEQTIHITDPYGSAGFDGDHDVHWPKDYHMKDCLGTTHPDHLPYGHNWPEFSHHGCAKLGLRYEDKAYPYNPYSHGEQGYGTGYGYHHPCKVIYRSWELIDWCQYTNNTSYGYGHHVSGKWTYIQKIYVYDDLAPEITFCPEDIVADGGDCTGNKVHVSIPKITAKDECGEVYYSYTRKYLEDEGYHHSYSGYGTSYGGNDASGYYEPGKTLVTFKAFDICGNTTECDMIVDVVAVDNKPPTVIAVSSITAVLMMTDTNVGSIEIWPGEFNQSSRDNCTSPENLKFKLEPSVFTCEDFGSNQVKFTVEDEAGNSDYTMVEVVVQANSFECMGGVVSGNVVANDNEGVEAVEVTLMDGRMAKTDVEGAFAFDNIPLGRKLYVTPFKDSDLMEGVDMYDYTLLSLHVDGLKELRDPKQLIAADIDGNKVIDYADLLAMQRLILGIDQKMENNTSWKFVKQGFVFPDTISPLEVDLPTSIALEPYDGGNVSLQFEGIKIGDLGNLVRKANGVGDAAPDRQLVTEDRLLKAGEQIRVPLRLKGASTLNGVSFTLDFDPSKLEIIGIDGGELTQIGSLNTVDPTNEGKAMATTWFSLVEQSFNDGEVLVEFTVQAKQPITLSKALSLTSTFAEAKAISVESGESALSLSFGEISDQGEMVLFQNTPNPFTERTKIGFYLPEAGEVTMSVKDTNGKEILMRRGLFEKGYQEFSIARDDLQANGLVFYQIISNGARESRKMILLN
jgi:hypothetical protein